MIDRRPSGRARAAFVIVALTSGLAGAWIATSIRGPERAATSGSVRRDLWTCGMHPQVLREEPGLCVICHMALTPLSGAADPGALAFDPVVVQRMGVRTARVRSGSIRSHVRALGEFVEREGDHQDVALRVAGVIRTLHAKVDGQSVSAGDPLFDLESPELEAAISELIAARSERDRSAGTGRRLAESLFVAARARLTLLGLDEAAIDDLARSERAPAWITIRSPMTGHMTAKRANAGARVEKGELVLRLASNATLWLDVRVPQRELGRVALGAGVQASVDGFPGETFEGRVVFVHPHVDMETRTARVRAEIGNLDGRLREGLWCTAEIAVEAAGDVLFVPRESVIETGTRAVLFVALGEGRFEPRAITLGARGDDGSVEVKAGLAAGEDVVVSGQFLLDTESRLREALRKFQALDDPRDSLALAPRIPAEATARIDALVVAYLALSESLGLPESATTPLDARALVAAARDLEALAFDAETARIVAEVARAARALADVPLDAQRELFKPLSNAVVDLASRAPPSDAVGGALFVVRCPMAPGSWLQRRESVSNPFYATSMKACGNVVRTIPLSRSTPK